jgi:hypothetical protein
MYLDLTKYFLFICVAVYFILAERGIIKLPTEKKQQEFDERMRNKRWKYAFITLAYILIGYSIFSNSQDFIFSYKLILLLFRSNTYIVA